MLPGRGHRMPAGRIRRAEASLPRTTRGRERRWAGARPGTPGLNANSAGCQHRPAERGFREGAHCPGHGHPGRPAHVPHRLDRRLVKLPEPAHHGPAFSAASENRTHRPDGMRPHREGSAAPAGSTTGWHRHCHHRRRMDAGRQERCAWPESCFVRLCGLAASRPVTFASAAAICRSSTIAVVQGCGRGGRTQ